MIPISQLRETISKRSDAQLLDMIKNAGQYTREAIDVAKEVCATRGVNFPEGKAEPATLLELEMGSKTNSELNEIAKRRLAVGEQEANMAGSVLKERKMLFRQGKEIHENIEAEAELNRVACLLEGCETLECVEKTLIEKGVSTDDARRWSRTAFRWYGDHLYEKGSFYVLFGFGAIAVIALAVSVVTKAGFGLVAFFPTGFVIYGARLMIKSYKFLKQVPR